MKDKQGKEYLLDRYGNRVYQWDWVKIPAKVLKGLTQYQKDKLEPNKFYQVELLSGSNIRIDVPGEIGISLNRKRFIKVPDTVVDEYGWSSKAKRDYAIYETDFGKTYWK